MAARGLLLAAPASGAGKTTVTLAILRALSEQGVDVAGAKSGPDYIDPRFHRAACNRPSVNLDAWAMSKQALRGRASATPAELLIIEGAMGVLDGAGKAGRGSAADLAAALGIPVIMILDIAKTAHSAVLAVAGLRAMRPDLKLGGVILNRVATARHAQMATRAIEAIGIPVLGAVPRRTELILNERHLGLVQASEHDDLDAFLDTAADIVSDGVDLDRLAAAAAPLVRSEGTIARLQPLGQRIAVARDPAFEFAYPHILQDWRCQGAELLPFSPLADQGPDRTADAVFLPGGYPELHAGTLSAADRFRSEMNAAASRETTIYGECGGYMVLGRGLVDADGQPHRMLGLLPVETSFASRKLSLGYRRLDPLGGLFGGPLMGHEFHYATVMSESGDPLFAATDADHVKLPDMGARSGAVSGSFAHVIGPAAG